MKRHLATLVLTGILGTMALAGNAERPAASSSVVPARPRIIAPTYYCPPVTYCPPTYCYPTYSYCSYSICYTTPATTAAPATYYAATPTTYTYPVAQAQALGSSAEVCCLARSLRSRASSSSGIAHLRTTPIGRSTCSLFAPIRSNFQCLVLASNCSSSL